MECEQIAITITADDAITMHSSSGVREQRTTGFLQAVCQGWLVQITPLPGAAGVTGWDEEVVTWERGHGRRN